MKRDPVLHELLQRRGNVGKIAVACQLTKAAIYAWEKVPAERAPVVAAALGIDLSQVRPDLWPMPATGGVA